MENNYLQHYGIAGMKWGVRRYQNADGSYTSAGRDRYGIKGYARDRMSAISNYRNRNRGIQDGYDREIGRIESRYKKGQSLSPSDLKRQSYAERRANSSWNDSRKQYRSDVKSANSKLTSDVKSRAANMKARMNTPEFKANARKVATVGGAVIASALAAYGGYKVAKAIQGKSYDKAYNAAKNWLSSSMGQRASSMSISQLKGHNQEVERVSKQLAQEASKNMRSVLSTLKGYDPTKAGIVNMYDQSNVNFVAEALGYLDSEARSNASYLRNFL